MTIAQFGLLVLADVTGMGLALFLAYLAISWYNRRLARKKAAQAELTRTP